MYKSVSSAFLFVILLSAGLSAQDFSIQGNGGIIMPLGSSKGLSGTVQLNYVLNQTFQLYIYSGHSVWDRRYYDYQKPQSNIERGGLTRTYWRDDHVLIPVYAGCRINFHTNKVFTSFVNIETGYSHLTYNSYPLWKTTDAETGKVLEYSPNTGSGKKHSEDLFAIGIGAGISHPMSQNINILLSFKLNSFANSGYNGFFNSMGTYTLFQVGVSFLI
jgi:hypothetical protein